MDMPWELPRTADELFAWLDEVLDVRVPRRAVVGGHAAPGEYLVHTFFEGGDGGEGSGGIEPLRPADCVVWANRGGGKTFLGAVATVLDLVFKPGIEVRVLGGSMEQSRRMHAHLRRLCAREAIVPLVKGRITESRIRLVNGSEVELLAQSHTSVRGTRVQKLRCDEVELFHPDVWEAAQLTTRSRVCGGIEVRGAVECLSTMHKPHGLMHALVGDCGRGVRRLFKWGVLDTLGPCGPEHRCVWAGAEGQERRCGMWEECGGRAKDEGVCVGHVGIADALRMKSRVSEGTWRAEMLCLKPSRTSAVVPEFEASAHVFDGVPVEPAAEAPIDWRTGEPAYDWIAGMDFGFTGETVILWATVEGADARGAGAGHGVVRVWRESAVAQTVLDEHIRTLLGGPGLPPRPVWVGCDPAGRQANRQTAVSDSARLRRAGLVVRDRPLPVRDGLELVRARLRPAAGQFGSGGAATPRLFVHASCRRLIESLEKYRYGDDDQGDPKPVKDGSDHAVDALRYMIQNLDRPARPTVRQY